ncbi:MAG: YgfZ/GcvT domain-containing protein [Rhizomicrobium sp.]
MTSEVLTDRALLEIRGEDARAFLQGLITNDIGKLAPDTALYAAMLTPQGKIVCDFLVYDSGPSVLLDCIRDGAADLQKRLLRYRLRTKVEFRMLDECTVAVARAVPSAGAPVWRDPRHPELGWRTVQPLGSAIPPLDGCANFLDRRLNLGIPEGRDFGCERMFALDADLDELHAISFEKGCYVGQELTARMKHRGTARKKLVPIVALESRLPEPESPVVVAEREIGTVAANYGTRGFALLRLDRLAEVEGLPFSAGGVPVNVIRPEWLFS